MADNVKVVIAERDGQNLKFKEELDFKPENMSFSDPGFAADNTKAAIIEAKNAGGSGTGSEEEASFFGQGSVGNRWVSLGASSKTSDKVPYIVIHDRDLTGFSWSNDDSIVDVDIEVYKNGIDPGDKIATFNIVNKKTVAKTDITPISLLHGDRISIFIKRNGSGANSATDPIIHLSVELKTKTSSEVTT